MHMKINSTEESNVLIAARSSTQSGPSHIMLSVFYYVLVSLPLSVIITLFGTFVLIAVIYFKSLTTSGDFLPHLYYKDSTLARFVIKRCFRLTSVFNPPFWIQNCHLQTIIPSLLPKMDVQFEREYLQVRDKGIIALDWTTRPIKKIRKTSPILFLLPGLTADAVSMGNICHSAIKRGFRPVVFNKRGHGDAPLTTPKLQSFGDPTDVRQAIKYIRGKFPCAKICAIGYSAGSGLLVSYLGEYGSSSYVTVGVCISPGYDADALFNGGVTQPYDWLLLFSLKRLLSRHAGVLSKVIDVDAAFQSKTLIAFEEALYCKLYGYQNMQQYWDRNNPMRDIDDLAVPLMCISSIDDPVCNKDLIPYDLFKLYPNYMLVATDFGGHCGFVENQDMESWADKVAMDYMEAVLEFTSNGYDRL